MAAEHRAFRAHRAGARARNSNCPRELARWQLGVESVKRGLGDALLSAGALTMLGIVLVSFDERVRDYAWRFASGASLAGARVDVRDIGDAVVDALRDQTLTHAPLTIFVVAGAILFLFMVKT
jgi:hypothetical protein